MPYKYAEITIIKNKEEDTFLSHIYNFLGYEYVSFNDSDKIIIEENDSVYELTPSLFQPELNIKFGCCTTVTNHFPAWFNLGSLALMPPGISTFELKPMSTRVCEKTRASSPGIFDGGRIDINRNGNIVFYKCPTEIDGLHRLQFNDIFADDKPRLKETSYHNLIYYLHTGSGKTDVFSILRIKSNEDMPRFVMAYNDTYMNKDTALYLTNSLLKRQF